MTDSLGLSIGMTNLVAARVGAAPVTRRAVLTLYPNRAPEVGLPAENPNLTGPGVVLTGFVERVGDPVPLVAPDGSSHQADRLLVEALDAMARTVGNGTPAAQVTIAVPAYWGPAVLGALRTMLRTKPNLSPTGVPPVLVSDAAAALAALVWGVTFLLPGRDVRERTVPVEFVNVPPGLVVASQSADAIEVWLRGSEFVFTSIDLTTLIVRCDLATAHQGVNRVVVGPSALDLPLGLEIAGLSPRQLTIRLTSS